MSDGPAAANHLSLDALAELEEGIASDAGALTSHLDGCAVCRERAGQLRASRALLSALPPEPMPADVASRIEAALAAEPAPAAAFSPRGDIVPLRGRRTWWRGPNIAAAAAGVAVLALGAALLIGHLGSKSPAESAAKNGNRPATGPLGAATAPNPLKQWQTGRDYNLTNLAALATGIVIGDPPPFPGAQTQAGAQPSPSPATRSNSLAAASYSRDALRDPAIVYACAALLASHPVQPIAIDYANFNGAPADILVLPGLSNPATKLAVYIIPTACSDSAPDLVYHQVDRPVTGPR